MPWWQFGKSESAEEIGRRESQRARVQEAIAALESGDIPPLAKQRIHAQLQDGKHLFSSNFSVREFLLSKESGIEPVSQVMGSCFYNAALASGWGSYMSGECELTEPAKAQTEARKRAIQRMSREAKLLGASGVIGVKLEAKSSPLDPFFIEFTAYGTAVKIAGYKDADDPFTSNLSAQDFWQLQKAGYRPKGIVMGLCLYYIINWADWAERTRYNGVSEQRKAEKRLDYRRTYTNWSGEIERYAKGFSEARNRAMRKLTEEVYGLEADGCIGMEIEHEIEGKESPNGGAGGNLLINFKALGTAIKSGIRTNTIANRSIYIDLRKERQESASSGFI
jgi:uncharacterized protein YbjQ (UPF0145 family)